MLSQKVNPKTGKKEYCLVSTKKPGKVLEYYGTRKPSNERLARSERRVEFYEKHGKSGQRGPSTSSSGPRG